MIVEALTDSDSKYDRKYATILRDGLQVDEFGMIPNCKGTIFWVRVRVRVRVKKSLVFSVMTQGLNLCRQLKLLRLPFYFSAYFLTVTL